MRSPERGECHPAARFEVLPRSPALTAPRSRAKPRPVRAVPSPVIVAPMLCSRLTSVGFASCTQLRFRRRTEPGSRRTSPGPRWTQPGSRLRTGAQFAPIVPGPVRAVPSPVLARRARRIAGKGEGLPYALARWRRNHHRVQLREIRPCRVPVAHPPREQRVGLVGRAVVRRPRNVVSPSPHGDAERRGPARPRVGEEAAGDRLHPVVAPVLSDPVARREIDPRELEPVLRIDRHPPGEHPAQSSVTAGIAPLFASRTRTTTRFVSGYVGSVKNVYRGRYWAAGTTLTYSGSPSPSNGSPPVMYDAK